MDDSDLSPAGRAVDGHDREPDDPATPEEDGRNSDLQSDNGSDRDLGSLTSSDREIIQQHERANAVHVHEIIRRRGIEELERPFVSLLWSAIGAGFVIGLSPYAQGVLRMVVPDGAWKDLIVALGYPLGFIAVIAGRMQLFTESTLTAVLPLATTPSRKNLWRTLRLWAIVLAGNVLGTFVFALFIHLDIAHQPGIVEAVRFNAVEATDGMLLAPFRLGVPAGFMLAVAVWAMPNLERQEILLIVLITFLMATGKVAHSVVGSAEMWVSVLDGHIDVYTGLVGLLLPAALGNLVGGAGLFALLAHAQVSPEIREGDESGEPSGDGA